ncbi:MAG: hypothetical protein QOK05_1482 [Chloroflexota bacterium]|jgi:hypothetical protein|nr:hypothetical protein [Chloroflexota bacterium]
MKDLALIAFRAVLGGTAVCAFALVGQMVQPKKFAGIFAAAPAVAVASLAITIATKGPAAGHASALGMIAGAFGMLAYCCVMVFTLRRMHALLGSLVAMPVWAAFAGAGLWLFTR